MNRVKRNVFVYLSLSLIFLIGIVFIFDPNNSFSKLVKEDFSFSNELYTINFTSSETSGVPENIRGMFSDEGLLYKSVEVVLNYKDSDGNSLEVDDSDWEYIEYPCGESTCELANVSEYWEEELEEDYWSFWYEDVSDNYVATVPMSITYQGVVYDLDHYMAYHGNSLDSDFCKPTITLNNQNIESLRFFNDYMWWYYSSKIKPNESLNDTLNFSWSYHETNVKLINNVFGDGADLNKSFYYEIWHDYDLPDGKYGDVEFSDDYGKLYLKNGESANLIIPGNYDIYINYYNFGYDSSSEVSDGGIITWEYYGEGYYLFEEANNNSITFNHEFIPAQPLTINNIVNNCQDPEKEFGITVYLDDRSINGVYSGVQFTNGIGRFHLRNGESISLLFPDIETGFYVSPTSYFNYGYSYSKDFSGDISADSPVTVDVVYNYRSSGETNLENDYSATVVSAEELIPGKSYIAFRATGGVGYLLTGKGNAKVLTSYESYSGGKVRWPNSGEAYSNVLWTYNGTLDKALFESFGAVNTYLTVGKSTSGNRPVGSEKSYVKIETTSSPAVRLSNGGYYLALTSDKEKYTSSTSANSLYFAEIDEELYDVEFDASNGGLHIYNETLKKTYPVIKGDEVTAPTEDNVKKPNKYGYKLESWIELDTGLEVEPGETFVVDGNYKFYANWVPETYDVGVNKNVVGNLDTSDFITTEVFDYSELFNLYSTSYNNGRWSLINKGSEVYFGDNISSRGIVFFDNVKNSKNGLLNAVDNRNSFNSSRQVNNGKDYYDGIVTPGISVNVVDDLFDKDSDLVGVNYVGDDSYLYQFNEKTGFYYYDSSKNAASYNKSDGRFYVYDYTIGTSKSFNEGENKSDFLPFNYLSKENVEKGKSISSSNGSVNYWFGLKSIIKFDLIDKPGTIDSNGNYGNKDVYGNDMILKFTGDDDVWVYVDDQLVLDLGGVHDIVYGEINFSTGIVTIAQNGASINYNDVGGFGFNASEISDGSKITQKQLIDIDSGEHEVTFYYVERGASRSNVSLYFNIAEDYDKPGDLIIKRDVESYDSDEKHEFTLTVADETIAGKYGDVEFVKGVATFKLSGGNFVKIVGLPAGLTYSISVKAPDGHLTKFTANGVEENGKTVFGRIVGGNTSNVDYINNYSEYTGDSDDITSPDTGDKVNYFVVIMFISLIVILSIGGYLIYSNKKKTSIDKVDII